MAQGQADRVIEIFLHPVAAHVQRLDVGGDQLVAALELDRQQLLDHGRIQVDQGGNRAKPDDVLEQLALPRVIVGLVGDAGQRHADDNDVRAQLFRRDRLGIVVEQIAAGLDRLDVGVPGLRVHRDHQVRPAAAGSEMTGFRNADFIPGGQALDVGWEDVARCGGDAHSQHGLGEQGVGAGRSRSIHVGELDDEVVDPLQAFYAVYLLQHDWSATATSIRKRCMSQAPVGQRSAHSPQCRQTSSSLAMIRPVFRWPET